VHAAAIVTCIASRVRQMDGRTKGAPYQPDGASTARSRMNQQGRTVIPPDTGTPRT
jgi:hypothetical protein